MTTQSELLSSQPAAGLPTEAPAQQHRPVMSVDRTDDAEASRHILLPVDDTEVDTWEILIGCVEARRSRGWRRMANQVDQLIGSGESRSAAAHGVLTQDSEVSIEWAIKNTYKQGDVFHLVRVLVCCADAVRGLFCQIVPHPIP